MTVSIPMGDCLIVERDEGVGVGATQDIRDEENTGLSGSSQHELFSLLDNVCIFSGLHATGRALPLPFIVHQHQSVMVLSGHCKTSIA